MNWYLLAGLFIVAWFMQNVLHEVSHLMLGWIVEGRKPTKMIPWPHKFGGKFYFSHYECGPATKLLGSPAWRHAAPLLMVCSEMTACLVLAKATEQHIWFLPWAVAAIVDALVWSWGFVMQRPGTDGQQFLSAYNHK
jgi:hypothetical protein